MRAVEARQIAGIDDALRRELKVAIKARAMDLGHAVE
jgi:hypothetical protein